MTIKLNRENYNRTLAHIKEHPESWDQTVWHCGSTHCFAGWAQLLSGRLNGEVPTGQNTRRDARIWLGLTMDEADYLFHEDRTMDDLEWFIRFYYKNIDIRRTGTQYSKYGYDADGLDENNNLPPY